MTLSNFIRTSRSLKNYGIAYHKRRLSCSEGRKHLPPKLSKEKRFLIQNPHCCFCGGNAPAVEIDHLPSRACFDNRNYPDGFEFPACHACNASTKDDEQVVALFSRMLSNPDAAAIPNEIGKYMSGVANNRADILREMAQGFVASDDNYHLLELGNATHQTFTRVLNRWAKAFHYKEIGVIVPLEGRIHVSWYTNANLTYIPPGALDGHVHQLRRNGRNIGDQFAYITRNDPKRPDLGYYTAAFRRSFLAIMLVDFYGNIITDEHQPNPATGSK